MARPPRNHDRNDYLAADEKPRRHAALDYRPPRSLVIIRRSLIVIVITALVAVVYTGYWFFIASNIKDGVKTWVEQRSGLGLSLAYERIEIGGFPFAFRIILRNPALAAARPGPIGGVTHWAWRGSGATIELKPWNLRRATIDLSGRHDAEFTLKGIRRVISGNIAHFMVATTIHSDHNPESVLVTLKGVDLKGDQAGQEVIVRQGRIFGERLFPAEITEKTPTFGFSVDLNGVKFPRQLKLPLGHSLAKLLAEGKVMGRINDIRSFDDLAGWRDAGGTLELERIEIKYGALFARATGTFAFDRKMQPVGAVTANIQGLFSTINALRDAKIIRSRDATMATLVLGALSRRPDNGGPASVSLPFSLQDGLLTAGPVTLMKVPPIKWPRQPSPKEGLRKL